MHQQAWWKHSEVGAANVRGWGFLVLRAKKGNYQEGGEKCPAALHAKWVKMAVCLSTLVHHDLALVARHIDSIIILSVLSMKKGSRAKSKKSIQPWPDQPDWFRQP